MQVAHSQDRHSIRLEWGPTGARELTTYAAERGPVVAVVVDVLSFTTTLSVAVDRGIAVYPHRWDEASARALATEREAVLARPRQAAGRGEVSLSPASVRAAGRLDRIVLPSPNGSTISALLRDAGATVIAASLRNATAVGRWIAAQGSDTAVVVVPAGERWPDGTLRPALEDLWGAGAVIDTLATRLGERPGHLSPEAELARLAYQHVAGRLDLELASCASGRELLHRGYALDVAIAAELNDSSHVPVLRDGAFVRAD